MKKSVKIYKESQLVLLRNIIPLLKKRYRIPYEVIEKAERILQNVNLGRTGFILIILEPLQNDMVEMQDIVNYYPHKLKIDGDINDVQLEEENVWLSRNKEWYLDTWKIKKESSYIYILYCMTLERLYGKEGK
ncbi:hypothetical protein AALA13_05765 [Lachnospiraceae bacterium 50-23]